MSWYLFNLVQQKMDHIYSLSLHPGRYEPKCDETILSLRALQEAIKTKSIPQG